MLTARQQVHALLWMRRLLAGTNYPEELSFIKGFLSGDSVCLDVGAHAGGWAYPLSKLVSHVYAFEALPYYAQVLRPALGLLGASNITVVNKAVSDRQDTVNLIWKDSSGKRLTGLTHIAGLEERQCIGIPVGTISLDDFIAGEHLGGKRLAFIKCDVEGYECQVIAGARSILTRWRPLVFVEAKDAWFRRYGKSSEELIGVMTAYGYSGNIIRPDGTLQEITAASYSGSGDILFRPDHKECTRR
jgi:FkbM family methyltransferase